MMHLLFMMFSAVGVCSKLAAQQEFFSFRFILLYGLMLLFLGIYAIAWQQVIKKLPLTTAFANKAVTVVWGMIWGVLIFKEHVSLKEILGGVVIVVGIILYSKSGVIAEDSNKIGKGVR